jgi:hypothetical protein
MRMGGLFLAVIVLGASCAPLSGGTLEARRSPQADEPVPTCQFPRFRPTYLPWLGEAERVPEPSRDRLPGGGPQGLDPAYAILLWGFGDISEPDGPRLAGTLSLWRSTESVGAIPADPAVPTLPDGAEGRLYGGSDGSWGIVWVDPFPSPYDDPCSETALSLDMPNLSSARQREELFQVARSLDRA